MQYLYNTFVASNLHKFNGGELAYHPL